MAGGRPRIWEKPEDLQKSVDDYFESTTRWTLSGLAVYIGIDRQTLYNYADRDEFFDIIKRARNKVESIYEERAIYENNPTGVIFALKNMGWSDKVESKVEFDRPIFTGIDLDVPEDNSAKKDSKPKEKG